jgi:hypothetical protein
MQFLEEGNASAFETEVEENGVHRTDEQTARFVRRVHAEDVDAERARFGAESVSEIGVVADDEESGVHGRRCGQAGDGDIVVLAPPLEARAAKLASKLGDDSRESGDVGRRNVFASFDNQFGLARDCRRVPEAERTRSRGELARVLRGSAARVFAQRV